MSGKIIVTEPPQPELFLSSFPPSSWEELIASLLLGGFVVVVVITSLEDDCSIEVVEGIMLVDEGSSEEELDSMLELLDVEDGTDVEELLGIEEVEDGGSDEDELLGGGSIGSSPLIVTMTSFTYVLPEDVPTVIVVALTGFANVLVKSTPTPSLCDVIV